MVRYHRIHFEKDYYAISEIVDIVAERFNITVRENSGKSNRKKGKRNATYQTMEMFIRRCLQAEAGYEKDGKHLIEVSERKHKYSREVVDKVVNVDNFETILKFYADPETQKEFAEPEQMANEYRAMLEDGSLDDFLKSLQKEESHESFNLDYEMEKRFYEHKLDIAADFICKYFIQIDEELLKHDLTLGLVSDSMKPTPDEMLAAKRLKDVGNYYKPKIEFAAMFRQANYRKR